MNTIVKMTFGSHLYGTAGPTSDTDYKGIFMPSADQVLLGKIPKSVHLGTKRDNNAKNGPEDVDHEVYSLHYFLELALRGETVALDMLHAPRSAIEVHSLTWSRLVANRQKFYTKNLRALVGYARRQAAKYGVKGSRLSDAKQVLKILRTADVAERIGDLELPELEHGRWLGEDDKGIRAYQICGKKLLETARVASYLQTLEKFVESYGARARQAERNEGIDWKAISHALRAGYQVYYILTQRGFEYPLPETELLIKVKRGELQFFDVAATLEELIDTVEKLSEESTLPEHADRSWWERWLRSWVGREVFESLSAEYIAGERAFRQGRLG